MGYQCHHTEGKYGKAKAPKGIYVHKKSFSFLLRPKPHDCNFCADFAAESAVFGRKPRISKIVSRAVKIRSFQLKITDFQQKTMVFG